MPSRLAGKSGAKGAIPARLTPIFRDREDLPAADSLSEAVRAALARAEALVVLCSPYSAASPWVAREIEMFRQLHPDRPILAALISGSPEEAFPAALLAGDAEPLAADLTGSGEARRLGLLKLIAGIAGVELDALVQRDAQRRIRRVMVVTLTSVLAMIIMAALMVMALRSRAEAERQRAEAEGLVEFMQTDLREELRGVGRLDVLRAANARALQHYASQDLSGLPPGELERRARLLHAIGEDEEEAGDLKASQQHFTEARRTTAALLARQPNDPDRIFTHAQSEFWIGQLAYKARDMAGAQAGFEAYDRLSRRLLAVAPHDPRSLQEVGYSAGNLCTLQLEQRHLSGLIDLCQRALTEADAAARQMPGNEAAQRDVLDRRGWLADAYRAVGDLAGARRERQAQASRIAQLLAADPRNARLERARIWCERALASIDFADGRRDEAIRRHAAATAALRRLVRLDPANQELESAWKEMQAEDVDYRAKEVAR